VVRGVTPIPRTKPSRNTGIGTTLPSGTRIEDVLDEDAESPAGDSAPPKAPVPGRRRSPIDVTLTSPGGDDAPEAPFEADSRDTQPLTGSNPGSTEPDVLLVSSASPATVQPTGEEGEGETPEEAGPKDR